MDVLLEIEPFTSFFENKYLKIIINTDNNIKM